MKNRLILLGSIWFLTLFSGSLSAKEGMWLPWLLSNWNEADMQAMGMQLTAEDVYSINQASLKDAIVSFGGFCTAEVISSKGLILTNHHCGYGQIQKHSTVENDLLKNGFWAMSGQEELTNPGLTATFIKYVKDVTNDILLGTTPGMDEAEFQKIIKDNIEKAIEREKTTTDYDLFVRPFYYGNQYFLFAVETFRDVRLVGAPPSSIGKYGADTDNWVWPRHTGDFSLFRIYSGKDNKPADVNEANVPYTPVKNLSISLSGFKPGDFTMVYGFPGRTEEYLPEIAVRQEMYVRNPARIKIRETLLELLDQRMRQSDEVRIKYAAKYASISNAWKKWIGANQGLKETKALYKKEKYEEAFTQGLQQNEDWQREYGSILGTFDDLYGKLEPHARAYDHWVEIAYRGLEILRYGYSFRGLVEATSDEDRENAAKKILNGMDGFYKDYDPDFERDAMTALMDLYYHSFQENELPPAVVELFRRSKGNLSGEIQEMYEDSYLTNSEERSDLREWLVDNPSKAAKKMAKDPIYNLSNELYGYFFNTIQPQYEAIQKEIDLLQRQYMKAQMMVFKDKPFYPDANSTLRITYGQVEGYNPLDAVYYNTQTYLDGVIAKYIPGDYEFDLPQKLIDLYESGDYGIYAEGDRMPVCFIASNHTSGGNSGSPALNAKGELIGLNFDRAWEGTMSDLNYDISRCRNIMVDIRYVLFIIDKFAGASYLVDEMDIAGGEPDVPSNELKKVPVETEG